MNKITKIHTDNAPAAVGPYSQAIAAGGMLYTSGQIALDPATGEIVGDDIKAQAEQVMKNLAAVLTEAGTSQENVIKTTCFLKDMGDVQRSVRSILYRKTGAFLRSCKDSAKGRPLRSRGHCGSVSETGRSAL